VSPWLEIIMPVRNPGSLLLETSASLVAQTTRDFGVLVSDNFSTNGQEMVAQCLEMLAAAGIPARRVQPPYELGRIGHWNWAHSQGEADWLKPLFVGDRLKPAFVERVRERAERPAAHLVRCDFEFHAEGRVAVTPAPFIHESLNPAEFLQYFPALGNWIGGPINVAYRRDSWQAVGGYPPHLPACADYKLNAMLAVRHGIEVIHEPLAEFRLHEQRFSSGIRGRRVHGSTEVCLTLRQLRNYCLSVGLPWPEGGVRRGVLRQLRIDYWESFKHRLKHRIGRA
jgi:hypothetical protein